MKQIGKVGDSIVFTGKELLLEIETGPPCQIAADLEVFSLAMTVHIRCHHAFGWHGVMRAAGRMNMVVARPPSHLGRVNPALELELGRLCCAFYVEFHLLCQILRPARKLEVVLACRQLY